MALIGDMTLGFRKLPTDLLPARRPPSLSKRLPTPIREASGFGAGDLALCGHADHTGM